ncbi:Hypothetical predicted protein [Paramuricea clavata]|uniref:Uncharacterized protein n=1 Tax=Paramuricea clavata TaxID=317549 RepID=A0A6S7FFV4_PARCT|nr:Hypothetical predicted protein [Paramuricea clavata]
MFEMIMSKLSKLDIIDGCMILMEQELKDVKESLEYVYAEVEKKEERKHRAMEVRLGDERKIGESRRVEFSIK